MPKIPRGQEQINSVKEQILESALSIIVEQGFDKLSMRKIASRLGITATTIYNYFNSKDELYFMIRIHGFEQLYRSFQRARTENETTHKRLRSMIELFIRFGIEYPDYYDIMFVNRSVPKYRESVGTELEKVAFRDKEMGLKTLALVADSLLELYSSTRDFSEEDARYVAIRLWCDLNGIVTLHNSRLLHEVDDNIESLVDRLVEDIFSSAMTA